MSTQGEDEKIDAQDDAIFDPEAIPTADDQNERDEGTPSDEGGTVRSLNKGRIALIGAVFVGGLLLVAMLGLFRGGESAKKKKKAEQHTSGTSAEKEVARLEQMQGSGSGEEETERPPDKEKELEARESKSTKLERLKAKLDEQEKKSETGGGESQPGPWEKAREQARKRRAQAYHKEAFESRRADLFAAVETPPGRASRDSSASSEASGSDGVESAESVRNDLAETRRRVMREVGGRGRGRGPLTAGASQKEAYLEQSHGNVGPNVHRLRDPLSPYTVQAGTMLPLVLETGIDSELPGQLRGRFARPVYDSTTGNHLLIPAGSTVLGEYNSKVEEGQRRVQVVWTRLILPNGKSLRLGNVPGVDLAGKSGYSDKVDNQWGQVGAGVALTSLLSAGAGAVAGPQSSLSQTPGQGALSGAGRDVAKTGKGIVERELDKKPRLVVRAGMRVGALVHEDLVLEPYRTRNSVASDSRRRPRR